MKKVFIAMAIAVSFSFTANAQYAVKANTTNPQVFDNEVKKCLSTIKDGKETFFWGLGLECLGAGLTIWGSTMPLTIEKSKYCEDVLQGRTWWEVEVHDNNARKVMLSLGIASATIGTLLEIVGLTEWRKGCIALHNVRIDAAANGFVITF